MADLTGDWAEYLYDNEGTGGAGPIEHRIRFGAHPDGVADHFEGGYLDSNDPSVFEAHLVRSSRGSVLSMVQRNPGQPYFATACGYWDPSGDRVVGNFVDVDDNRHPMKLLRG